MNKKTGRALIRLSQKNSSCEECFAKDFTSREICPRCGTSPINRVRKLIDQLAYLAYVDVFGEAEAAKLFRAKRH